MSTGIQVRRWAPPWPAMLRALPFGVFICLMAVEPWLAVRLAGVVDAHWLYGVRTVVAAGLICALWRHFEELNRPNARPNGEELALALVVGVVMLLVWVSLDGGIFVIGQSGSGFDPRHADGGLDWVLALMRLSGSVLVVPVMEELFWRSLVMRWLERDRFSVVAPATIGLRALLLSSLAFGLEHSQWLAGVLAGLAYGWLYIRTGKLWTAVFAHVVTNAGLGAWVLANGAWHFW